MFVESPLLQSDIPPLTYILVGLGNPGREYRLTRHNMGFMAIDRLSQDLSIKLSRMQANALVGTGLLGGNKLILAKPQTFMNLSGQALGGLVKFYKIPLTQVIVIHDDLDLPLGTIRIRPGGGSGGQKGLASIIDKLGTPDFPRLRIGIGRPPGQMDTVSYVLQSFSSAEEKVLKIVLDQVLEAGKSFIINGLEKTMNRYNGVVEKEK